MSVFPFNRGDSVAAATNAEIRFLGNRPSQPHEKYAMLRAFYNGNGLYKDLTRALVDLGEHPRSIRPLRNPTYRIVESFVAHLWPGRLADSFTVETENAALLPVVERIWRDSNWAVRKSLAARSYVRDGDLFVKVAQTDDLRRVYLEVLDPAYVTDFDVDERGFVTYLRIDVPIATQTGGSAALPVITTRTLTEVWSKANQVMRRYEHDKPVYSLEPEAGLGDAVETIRFDQLGVDFVPIVHAKFRDIGEIRGQAAVWPTLDKIISCDKKASRLEEMLFRHGRPTWAITATGTDTTGRPVPAIRTKRGGTGGVAVLDDDSAGELQFGDDVWLSLPGGYEPKALVPNIDYRAQLDAVLADVTEIRLDHPILALSEMQESRVGDLSGIAIRRLHTTARAQIIEAQENADHPIVRAVQMGATLGANARQWDAGTYESGALDFSFRRDDPIPLSDLEQAQIKAAEGQALLAFTQAGVPIGVAAQHVLGWDAAQVAALQQQAEAQAAQLGDRMLTAFDRGAA